MSHIINLYWAILDQNGNSVDGVMYTDEDSATNVMTTLVAADPSLTLTVTQQEQILY